MSEHKNSHSRLTACNVATGILESSIFGEFGVLMGLAAAGDTDNGGYGGGGVFICCGTLW